MQNHSLNATRFQRPFKLEDNMLTNKVIERHICQINLHMPYTSKILSKTEQMQLKDQGRWFAKINN